MIQFRTTPRALKAAALFISTDETRDILNGIQVEISPGGRVLFVATDGRRLFVLNATDESKVDEATEPVAFLIPKVLLAGLPKPTSGYLTVECDEKWVSVEGNRKVTARVVTVNYPRWREVIPTGAPTPMREVLFNPGFLESFIAAQALISSRSTGVRVTQAGENGPFLIRGGSAVPWLGVLMPIRAEMTDELPAWIS